jgi:hypothetical protein
MNVPDYTFQKTELTNIPTRRDLFAAAAMTKLMDREDRGCADKEHITAKQAFVYADAMLKASEAKGGKDEHDEHPNC